MNIIHQEGKNMENKEQEKKAPATEELSQEQMSNAAGAGFFARVGCFFRGHHGMRVTIQRKAYKGDLYEKLQCQDCEAYMYEKNGVECSESDFNSVPDR